MCAVIKGYLQCILIYLISNIYGEFYIPIFCLLNISLYATFHIIKYP